jgi:hypothetical protein
MGHAQERKCWTRNPCSAIEASSAIPTAAGSGPEPGIARANRVIKGLIVNTEGTVETGLP